MLPLKTTRFKTAANGLRYLVLGFLLIMLPAQALADDAVKWYSYEEGQVLGKIQNKKMFIHFWADWCRYCKKMDQETFGNAAVIAYLNANFIAIKVNTERERQTAAQYNIRPLPDNWFVASSGERISNQPGFIEPEMFIKILEYIHTDSYLDTSFMKFMQSRR
jgi:thioredoxin-related protein